MDIAFVIFMIVLVGVFLLIIYVLSKIYLSRYYALKNNKKEVSLFGGIMKLILWETNEGLIFLRNKVVSEIICNSAGGTKFIFPLRGDELRARVPLTLRLLTWQDEKILTRESIQVRMKVALWWQVTNLKPYVFNIDQNVHVGNTHNNIGSVESAEMWLKTMTESTLRTIVSDLSVAFLVSSKATSYLHVEQKHNHSVGQTTANEILRSESMADDLRATLAAKTADYGITIQRIEIQEIGLSPEIQTAIDKVWKSTLLPAQTEQEAKARKIELQAVSDVLGVEATRLNEVMRNFHGTSFYGMPQFLESLFNNLANNPNQKALSQNEPQQLPPSDSELK